MLEYSFNFWGGRGGEWEFFFLRHISQCEPKILNAVITILQYRSEKTFSDDMETANPQPV